MHTPGYEPAKVDLDPEILKRARPLAGRCVVKLEERPSMEGLLHLPDTAVDQSRFRQPAWFARVLAMTPRRNRDGSEFQEDFQVGDRVWIMVSLEDLRVQHRVIMTLNSRVYAREWRDGER